MRSISFFSDKSFASRTKGFDRICFSFLHFDIGVSLNTRDCLSSMNFIRINGMAIEIFTHFYRICSSSDLNFIWFHCLLDQSSNISQSHINTSLFYAGICCILHCLKKVIIHRIKSYCECSINNPSIDMSSKIDFHDIIFSKDTIISWIWGVMSCAVINRTACWEGNSWKNAIFGG